MKRLIFILTLCASFAANAQGTKRLFGNGFYNIRNNKFGWFGTSGTDTVGYTDSLKVKWFKPVRPGVYTTSGLPAAATYPGYVIYNTDSSKLQFSNGSSWANVEGAAPAAVTPNYELFFSDLSSTTVANTVTQTSLYGSGAGTAQFSNITQGSILSLKGSGTISTDATPGVPEFSFTTGSYTLGIILTGLTGGLVNVPYDYEYTVTPLATGTSQDIIYSARLTVYETSTTLKNFVFTQLVSASFTTTGTPSANVQVEWDAADADNSVVGLKNIVEIYRK